MTDPTFEQAVAELMRLSGWTRKDVEADVHSAYWAASAWIAKCQRAVEAGKR